MIAKRVLVGRIYQETHSFNPVPTSAEDFSVERGAQLFDAQFGERSILAGLVRRLDGEDIALVPSISAMARPGGRVAHAFFSELEHAIVETAAANRVDAIALDLHGAMLTDRSDDPEGDLLAKLRDIVGPKIPIVVGLDLHAHVTARMLGAANACIACKTNPHGDFFETGEQLAELLRSVLAGSLRPVTSCAMVPMILPGALETDVGPLRHLHALARDWMRWHPEIHDISLFNTTAFIDVVGSGQAVTAISHGPSNAAAAAVRELAATFWRLRHEFTSKLPSIDEALNTVMRDLSRRPVVFGDQGDRVLAGAPGDGTAILERLIERQLDLRCVVPVTDPWAVAALRAAGLGARVTLEVGGRLSPGVMPVRITGTVAHLSDGSFTLRGPYLAGQKSTLGPTAVLRSGNITVLVTSRSGLSQDPAAFASQNIDLGREDVIVSKSGSHFKLSFAGIATPLVVGSPGMSLYRPGLLPYRAKRPIWPEDDLREPALDVRVFPAADSAWHAGVADRLADDATVGARRSP